MKSAHQPCEAELHVLLHLLISAAVLHSSRAFCRTDPPVDPEHPFLFMWNAPTELCQSRYEVRLDLSNFHFVSSTLKTATNQRISIFYSDRFGIFPYIDEDTGDTFEEGLPQNVDLDDHREEAEDDIENYIPELGQAGLAVLDFEDWRPQWVRNWGSKDIYRQMSIELVKKRYSNLTDDAAEDLAQVLFDRAARRYFTRSVRIGRRLRPARLWGYYLFPDCYNYDYHQDMEHYSGECPAIERERNDDLRWLWNEVTALYPSIYLDAVLKDSRQARLYVRYRMHEAMRVSMLASGGKYSTPVYAYIRPVYKDSVDDYMSEYDLVNTIGEAAAMGASGVVSWGDMQVSETEDTCIDAKLHLERVMNRYILNVSTATKMCSRALCQSQGRCVRKHWDSDDYLHLDSRRFYIFRYRSGRLDVKGEMTQEDVDWFDRRFDCLCYSEVPCRSALTLNLIPELDINTAWSHSAGGQLTFAPHQTQLLVLLLWMYFVI